MITRNKVISKAVKECMKELYSFVQPSITWEDFIEENKKYKEELNEPKPFEFYYLPKEIVKDIVDSYVYAYRLEQQQDLLNIIEILKNYCETPIIEKYIEGENGNPGYRGYDHPDNLEKELTTLIKMYCDDSEADFGYVAKEVQNKFFEFLDMAGKFYKWNIELNNFTTSIYLGASPSSNKEEVIKNWKKYRNKDIEIDEEQIKKEYYGDDE